MNGKKARKLRKKAQSLTVGNPEVEYIIADTGSTILTPTCTKGAYRKLKQDYLAKKRTSRGNR